MLPADVNQLLQTLKNASFAVKRLSAKRNAPNDYRKAVESLNWKTQPIIFDEILVLRNAAVQVVKALNDNDIKTGWVGPVPWQTIYRHATNALGWLDKFRADITEYMATQDPKLARSIEHYERFKLTMINSIDDVFGKSSSIRLETVPYWRKVAANWLINLSMGIAGLTGCANHTYAEEPKVTTEVKTEVDISDFTDEVAKKLCAKYENGKAVLDDKEFASKAQFSYETYENGTSGFAKFLETAKEDTYLVLSCDFNSKDDLFAKRSMVAAKYLADKYGIHLRNLDSTKEGNTQIFKNLANKYNLPISNTSFFLVSRFDLVAGETKEKNDGKLKIIDVISGGPKTDDVIDSLVRSIGLFSLPTNIFAPNNEYVWRAEDRKMDNPWKKIAYKTK